MRYIHFNCVIVVYLSFKMYVRKLQLEDNEEILVASHLLIGGSAVYTLVAMRFIPAKYFCEKQVIFIPDNLK